MSTTSTVSAGVDCTVRADRPDRPFPKSPVLRVEELKQEALLRFKSPAPADATIERAFLRVYQAENATGTFTLRLDALAGPQYFRHHQTTWRDRPSVAPGPGVTVKKVNPRVGDVWEFPIVGPMQAIADGGTNYGFKLRQMAPNPQIVVRSLQATRKKPHIFVEWSTGTPVPSNLVPGYGAVSLPRWVQSCDYPDRSGTSPISGVWLRITALPNLTFSNGATVWESGAVASTVARLDLAATTFPGLRDGESCTVEMSIRANGRWSLYSDPATVTRRVHGVLTIRSPGLPPNDYVTEFTPPVEWAFTKPQTTYRVRVVFADDPRTELYDSGVVSSPLTVHAIPENVLVDERRHRVVVAVRDDVANREATTGDPAAVHGSRDFDVRYTDDQVSSVGVVAQQVGKAPWVDVTVFRTTTPDSWTLLRREVRPGKKFRAIAADIVPITVRLDDGVWVIRDWTARPGVEYQYDVAAEVNGVLYRGGPVANCRTAVEAVWVFDPETGQYVILGGKEIEFQMGDVATTANPFGSLDVVRVVQSMTGMAGTLKLMYRDRDGLTWQDQEDTLYDFKERYSDTFRLVAGDHNVPVVLGDVDPSQVHEESRSDQVLKVVKASFWQNGEHRFKVEV